jgi:glycosyltransferase involved in cell wall biosynthesis
MNKISIIIPCYNEEKYIENCITSILRSDVHHEDLELFLVDGMSSDGTREIIKRYTQKYSFIKLLDNLNRVAPYAMNIGIKQAQGEYIFILSAHAKYNSDYFSVLVSEMKRLNADCVGAMLVTDVKNKTKKSNEIKKVLSNKFGVGNASFRTGVSEVTEVDTVAFGCYQKRTFEKYGLFDETLIRNQDIELNKRIVNGGGKIYLIPSVECTYYARETFGALAKNQYLNGYWNILTAYYTKSIGSLSLRHFVPLFFMLSLLIPLIVSPLIPQILWISAASFVSYLTLVIIISLRLKEKWIALPYLVWGFLILHFSYGLGSLAGLFTAVKKMIKGET